MASKRVTMLEVAIRSGVSSQTVSRVINGDVHVSKKTRQQVLDVIDALNYKPNRAAQSLVTNQSNIIEVITFGANHYGPAQTLTNIQREAQNLGYNLIYSTIVNTSREEIVHALDSLSGRLVDGIILITPVLGATHQELVDACRGTPFVQVDNEQGSASPSVVINQIEGGRLAVQHLINLGHRQIGEISGPGTWFAAKSRIEGGRRALAAAGLQPVIRIEGNWTAEGGYQSVRALLSSGPSFTALVVGNDQMALGAIYALQERGLKVPEDVSVVGFDDIPESAYFRPALTTVRQDFRVLGRQAVEYLVALINDPETPTHQRLLQTQLIVRNSTTPLR